MIAILSSTLRPSAQPDYDGRRTTLSPETRLAQTANTVRALVSLGYETIFIADNSPEQPAAAALAQLRPAKLHHFGHAPSLNKGIAEARLLLALCDHLPPGVPLQKISARYVPSLNLCAELQSHTFVGLALPGRARPPFVSTRSYAVRDAAFLRSFLLGCLEEIYQAPWRINGPRSLWSVLRQHFGKKSYDFLFSDPPHSIEGCAGRWLHQNRIDVRFLPRIGITGIIGGNTNARIDE